MFIHTHTAINMKTYRYLLSILFLSLVALSSRAYEFAAFHCDEDTTLINSLLASPELKELPSGDRVAFFAR